MKEARKDTDQKDLNPLGHSILGHLCLQDSSRGILPADWRWY